MEHQYKFNVAMSCGGCSGAVTRVLSKLDGTSMNLQTSKPHSSTHTHTKTKHPRHIARS